MFLPTWIRILHSKINVNPCGSGSTLILKNPDQKQTFITAEGQIYGGKPSATFSLLLLFILFILFIFYHRIVANPDHYMTHLLSLQTPFCDAMQLRRKIHRYITEPQSCICKNRELWLWDKKCSEYVQELSFLG